MIGFSLAFAIPFFFLALFPQYLARMPRSGSWLTAVKVYMGFLEIAAALKFLSSADLAFGWRFLTFPVFLWIWFAIFVLAALYLLGVLPKASGKIGITRYVFGALTVGVSAYCILAIYGAPIGQISGFVPPKVYPGTELVNAKVKWLDSMDEAIALAKKENKPIFVNFTGYTCTNCRVMEQDFFPRPEIERLLQGFVTVELYTDRNTADNKANQKLLLDLVGSAANPTYVIVRPSDEKPIKVFQGLAQSADSFIEFLEKGKEEAAKKPE
jgi:thiol:disulfide interchange protein DsbD